MRLYQDRFTEDELFSDAYPMEKCFKDCGVKIQSRLVPKGSDQVKIAADDEFEDEDTVMVNDVVQSFEYNEIHNMSMKEFVGCMKAYIKRVTTYLTENGKEDRLPDFKAGMAEMGAFICKNPDRPFKDLQVFTGKSFEEECQYFVSYYEDGQEAPVFLYFLDGCDDFKC